MGRDTYSYQGKFRRVGPATDHQRTTNEAAKEIAKIRSSFDAGNPFFTKEAIQDVCHQFKTILENGRKQISVRGMDGSIINFALLTGQILSPPRPESEPETEYIVETPFINYQSTPGLLWDADIYYPHLIYSHLWIAHWRTPRNKFTKQLLTKPYPTMPPEYIRECFKTDVRSWEASEQCRQLTSTLISASSSKVDKIVAFACNTISDPEEEYASRSTFQHALILTIRDILANKDGNPKDIACYAQDPAYTNTDRSVLAEAGITVLDDPEGFLIADESTVVISCASNVPVKQIISDITQPAIMVWDRIRGETRQIDGKEFVLTDPDSPRLRQMVDRSYDQLEFPKDEEHFWRSCNLREKSYLVM